MIRDRALTAVLTLAVALSPALLDRCLLTCESHASLGASQTDAGQTCHRLQHPRAQQTVKDRAPRCGHDHGQNGAAAEPGSSAASAAKAKASPRMSRAETQAPGSGTDVGGTASAALTSPESPPDRGRLTSSAVPLRV